LPGHLRIRLHIREEILEMDKDGCNGDCMVKELSERKYQGVCRKCPCFEDSVHTDSGMWCYWWKDDDKPDCSTRLALESLESEIKALNEQLHPIVYDYNIMKDYDEERKKEDLEICDAMRGGPIIRELEIENKALREIIDSLTGDERLAIFNWKKLFDSYIDLRDKNKSTEAMLMNARIELKDQCPDIEKCQDLPSDPNCDGCERFQIWEALGGNKLTSEGKKY
jgi:hypothetical protein